MKQVDELHQLFQAGVEANPTKITVSSMPVLNEHFLPGVITNFSENHQKARFQVAVQKSPEVISSREAHRFDTGLAKREEETGLIKCRRLDIDCVCALPSGDPLLRKSIIEPTDLAARLCASFRPEHHITKAVKIAFDSAGASFDPKIRMQNGAAQYEIIGQVLRLASSAR